MTIAALRPHQIAARDALVAQGGGGLRGGTEQNAERVLVSAAGAIARTTGLPLAVVCSATQEQITDELGIHEAPDVLRILTALDAIADPDLLARTSVAIIADLPTLDAGAEALLRGALRAAVHIAYLSTPRNEPVFEGVPSSPPVHLEAVSFATAA